MKTSAAAADEVVGLIVLFVLAVTLGPFLTAWCVNQVVHLYVPNAPVFGWWHGLAANILMLSLRGGK